MTDSQHHEAPSTTHELWDGRTPAVLAEACGIARVEVLSVTDSTLDVAHSLAEQGAKAGTTVLADAQRLGRGRMGRSWSSESGRGVWCAVIERPGSSDGLDLMSIRVGIEIAERLDTIAGEQVNVKWPNDLMRGIDKLGGILCEARWAGTNLSWVAIGVGVNTMRPDDQPRAVGLPRGVKRVDVLAAIVAGVRAAATRTGHLSDEEMARFRSRDALRTRRIMEPIAGIVSGISRSGELIVETREGTKRLRVGTIRMAEGL